MQGDAAVAFVVGSDADGPLVAELMGTASITDKHIERWRAPGEPRTRVWDERFSEIAGLPLAVTAWNMALESAGLTAGDVALAAVAAPVQRVARDVGGKLDGVQVIDDLSSTVGIAGAAQPGLLLPPCSNRPSGADPLAGERGRRRGRPPVPCHRRHLPLPAVAAIATQLAAGGPVSYGKFLAWNGVLPVEPPRRR